MQNQNVHLRAAHDAKTPWLNYILIALVFEKVIQHVFVTTALYLNLGDIRSTVVPDPDILMVLGVPLVIAFAIGLWGILARQKWAAPLVIALSIVDIVGEFAAQGTFAIQLNVSFIVATALLVLAVAYWQEVRRDT